MKKKVEVECKTCHTKYCRNADNIEKWNGNCKKCSIRERKLVK